MPKDDRWQPTADAAPAAPEPVAAEPSPRQAQASAPAQQAEAESGDGARLACARVRPPTFPLFVSRSHLVTIQPSITVALSAAPAWWVAAWLARTVVCRALRTSRCSYMRCLLRDQLPGAGRRRGAPMRGQCASPSSAHAHPACCLMSNALLSLRAPQACCDMLRARACQAHMSRVDAHPCQLLLAVAPGLLIGHLFFSFCCSFCSFLPSAFSLWLPSRNVFSQPTVLLQARAARQQAAVPRSRAAAGPSSWAPPRAGRACGST